MRPLPPDLFSDPPAQRPPPSPGASPFALKLLSVIGVGVLVLLLWRLSDLLMLVFAAAVLAVALHAMAEALERHVRVPQAMSLVVTLVLIVGSMSLVVALVGDPLVQQLTRLRDRLPEAYSAVMGWLHGHSLGQQLLDVMNDASRVGVPWARVAGMASLTFVALGNLALLIILAVYLAAAPGTYRRGLVRLMPPAFRPPVDDAMKASAVALRRWLLGQAISMLFVGVSTGIGLWALGIPLPLAVGLISGLLGFIPFFGSIAGGLLATVLAFLEGPQAALYVALLCIAIQQVEGNLLMPVVQRWAVSLPPVLGILASVLAGLLFGVVGVLFATPLMVVVMTLVQRLYIADFLEREQPPPPGRLRDDSRTAARP